MFRPAGRCSDPRPQRRDKRKGGGRKQFRLHLRLPFVVEEARVRPKVIRCNMQSSHGRKASRLSEHPAEDRVHVFGVIAEVELLLDFGRREGGGHLRIGE